MTTAPPTVTCPPVVWGDAYRVGQLTLELASPLPAGAAPSARAGLHRAGLSAPYVRPLAGAHVAPGADGLLRRVVVPAWDLTPADYAAIGAPRRGQVHRVTIDVEVVPAAGLMPRTCVRYALAVVDDRVPADEVAP